MQYRSAMEQMLLDYGVRDVERVGKEQTVTLIAISGARADALGRIAMETIATLRGKPVKVTGASHWHRNAIYAPMNKTLQRKRFGKKEG